MRRGGVGQATYLFGVLSGLLLAMIAQELWPTRDEETIEQFRSVRDFAREAFVRDVTDEELLDYALHGMISGLDGYSRYYNSAEATELERETQGRFKGIGVIFRQPVADGQVLFPVQRSPAHEAGVRVGDRFLSVDGVPVSAMDGAEFRNSLQDLDGGGLNVQAIGLDGVERDLLIIPDSIVDPTVRHTRIIDDERGVGYLAIVAFSRETHVEFDRAFQFLRGRGMKALVVDVRGNYGGVLDSAVHIARRFVSAGPIVSTEGRGQPTVYHADPEEAWYEGFPLVVLVDSESASASEVLAGCLQDHRAAVVVGSPSYGKGMVQTIRRFREWKTIAKVTSSYYYSPSHRNFERSVDPNRDYGILPDLSIRLSDGERALVHAFLDLYGPPLEAIPQIEAWEEAEGIRLQQEPPPDAQLTAAVDLFHGRRPGPHELESDG